MRIRPFRLRFVAAVILLAAATPALAANYFACTVGGNWGTLASWRTSSCACGGVAPAALPTIADTATICDLNGAFNVNISPTVASLTMAAGTNSTTLNINAGQTLTVGSAAAPGNVTLNGPTATDTKRIDLLTGAPGGTLTVNGNVAITGGNAANRIAQLRINAGAVLSVNTTTGGANGDLTLGTTNAQLTLNGAGTATVQDAITNNTGGTITVGSGTLTQTNATGSFVNNAAVTASTGTITVGGSFTNAAGSSLVYSGAGATNVAGAVAVSGTYTPATSTFTLNGGSAQTLSGATLVFNNLTLNNGAGADLNANARVTGTLAFSNGRLRTGANTLTLGTTTSAGTVTGVNASRFVVGNLVRNVPINAGTQTIAWDVGVETPSIVWAPVSVVFSNVSAAGTVLVTTTNGAHGSFASSALDSAQRADRYWTLTNTGTTYVSVAPTLTFVPGDVIGGATATTFIAGKFALSAWSYPDLGTRTATSTPTTGILFADGLGDFALAESRPPAYSEYRFEQAAGAYNGTAGEVVDSGTGVNHGTMARLNVVGNPYPTTANATPAIAGNPGSCRYGVFNRTFKQYVALPAGYPNLGATSSFTVSAWIRSTDVTQPAQRIFIDDEQNSGSGWGLSLAEGGTGTLRFYTRGAASVITTDTANVIANNTWYFVAAVADIVLKRKRVFVFNAAGTLVGYNTAVWTEASFGADAGVSSIGGETNASNGENTNGFGFAGNIDYVRVHMHPLGVEHLQQLRQETHHCIIPDHYAVSFPAGATAVTCDPHQVTVTAHDAAHAAMLPSAGIQLSLGTSSSIGVWTLVSGGGLFTPVGSNIGQATYTWSGGESAATFALRHNPAVTNLSINLFDTYGKVEAAAHDPFLNYADAAFRISNGANVVQNINTQIAGKPSNTGFNTQNLFLQAIRTGANGACTSIFPPNAEVDISVGATCNNPTTCAQSVSLTTTSTTSPSTGTFVPNNTYASTIRFRFSGSVAEAPFNFNYADAGQISLLFRAPLPAPPASTTFSGSSNVFVVRPFGLAISGVTTSGSPGPAVAANYVAGTNFNATVTAKQWKTGDDTNNNGVPDSEAQIAGNAATPNFGQETPTAATVAVTHTLNAPAGGAAGTLTGGTFSGFMLGVRTQAISWSESGFINLFATSAAYLGGGSSVTNSAAGLTGVGKFRPDRFAVTNRGTLAPGCIIGTDYTYLGQPLTISNILIEAQNASGVATTNYRGAYALFDPATFTNFAVGGRALDGAGTNLAGRIGAVLPAVNSSSGTWGANTGVLTASITTAIKRASPDTPDRFTQARLGIAPADADGVAILTAAKDLNVDAAGPNDVFQLVGAAAAGNLDLRFGRLRLLPSSGPSRLAHKVNIRTEYWNGTSFVLNTDDGCTTIPRTSIELGFTTGSPLQGCDTAITTANVAFTGGLGALTLSAPGVTNSGNVLITPHLGATFAGSYCPSSPGSFTAITAGAGNAWLLGRWNDAANPDADANTSYDDKPSGRISFDIYGAQPGGYIFFRENY